jgi:hypothetical protein
MRAASGAERKPPDHLTATFGGAGFEKVNLVSLEHDLAEAERLRRDVLGGQRRGPGTVGSKTHRHRCLLKRIRPAEG